MVYLARFTVTLIRTLVLAGGWPFFFVRGAIVAPLYPPLQRDISEVVDIYLGIKQIPASWYYLSAVSVIAVLALLRVAYLETPRTRFVRLATKWDGRTAYVRIAILNDSYKDVWLVARMHLAKNNRSLQHHINPIVLLTKQRLEAVMAGEASPKKPFRLGRQPKDLELFSIDLQWNKLIFNHETGKTEFPLSGRYILTVMIEGDMTSPSRIVRLNIGQAAIVVESDGLRPMCIPLGVELL